MGVAVQAARLIHSPDAVPGTNTPTDQDGQTVDQDAQRELGFLHYAPQISMAGQPSNATISGKYGSWQSTAMMAMPARRRNTPDSHLCYAV